MNLQKSKSVRNSNFAHSRLLRLFPPLVLLLLVLPAYAKYGGGTGTLADSYKIATPEQLYDIGKHEEDWDKCFKLVADIDLSAYKNVPFNPIGTGYGPDGVPEYGRWFRGVFDGDGHTISNFTHHSPNFNDVGLFGTIVGEVKNLGLVNVDVSGHERVGGLAGVTLQGGGYPGDVSNCYVTGRVSGQNDVGGLVGRSGGRIHNCYSTAEVSGDYYRIGGLVGGNDGGLVYNCYTTGWVTANRQVGGLVGSNGFNGRLVASFWDVETTGQAVSYGGHGRTTAEMKMASTFFGWGGCDSEGVWTIDEGKDYPRLAWEGKPGQPITGQLSDIVPGSGTAADPYLISTAEQLNSIGLFPCERNRYFRLMADIDLSSYKGTEFNMIGVYYPFSGSFDGNRHTISNFTYDSLPEGEDNVGLFGEVATGAVVKNLGLIDVDVAGRQYVGGLAGRNNGGKISNCYVTGQVRWGGKAGALVGSNNGTVTTSWATASVAGGDTLGGFVGENNGTLSDCYAIAPVSANYDFCGGLVGNNAGQISNCYAAGPVTGPANISGGLVGKGTLDVVANSFWDVQATGQTVSAGGTGKATAFMMTRKTFTDAGWDFVGETANGTEDTWSISEGTDYPCLSWATMVGGPNPPDGATSVDPNVTLTWMPSPTAESHDVYFGDSVADVEAGTGGTFQGSQFETSFTVGLPGTPYPEGLIPGATYYWRIDEHNAGGGVARGNVWSFTVKPFEPVEETVEYQVTSSEDDGYAITHTFQNIDTDSLKVGSSSFAKPPYYMSGMVFRNVNIPQGTRILNASLKIRAHNSQLTDTVYGMIQAEASDDAAGFGVSRNIGSVSKTNASVDWDLDEPWSADTWYTSPDIAGVIQEVIDRGGWSANNALAILYCARENEVGYRKISSFDRGSDYAPILEITYIP